MRDVDRLQLVLERIDAALPHLNRAVAELDGSTRTCPTCDVGRWNRPDEFKAKESLRRVVERTERARRKIADRLEKERGRE